MLPCSSAFSRNQHRGQGYTFHRLLHLICKSEQTFATREDIFCLRVNRTIIINLPEQFATQRKRFYPKGNGAHSYFCPVPIGDSFTDRQRNKALADFCRYFFFFHPAGLDIAITTYHYDIENRLGRNIRGRTFQ